MFGELLESRGAFGIVWVDDGALHEVGCACRIEQVLEEHEDGRIDVLCRGTVPFVIDGPLEHIPYPSAPILLLEDDESGPSRAASDGAKAALLELVDLVHASRPAEAELDAMDAYAMAARVGLGLAVKQRLLEERHEDARLAILADELGRLREGLSRHGLGSAIARSNGRVRF